MGATSVTGVGLGSADGSNKGSPHMTLGAEKLVGPRVVAADAVTLSGTTLTVKLPNLGGSASDYIVNVTDADTTAADACAATLTMDATATTVSLKGPSGGLVYYSIIKKGLAI
jgi:hypothetical protein